MTVHLIKLCVGTDDVPDLRDWQQQRQAAARANGDPFVLKHVTRNTPRRKDEILEGGSLYWVIRRFVQVRQRIIAIEPDTREDGGPACALVLDPELVETRAWPHRPFQGWRYLPESDAPPDISSVGGETDALPAQMKEELRSLGLL
jgi:hypothetical protein